MKITWLTDRLPRLSNFPLTVVMFLVPILTSCGTNAPSQPSTNNPATSTSTATSTSPTSASGFNAVPTITSLYPSCAPAGSLDSFVNGLTVGGTNFGASSVVRWNGSDQPTTLDPNSAGTILTAQISASDIAAAGTAAITVFNPAPGGGSSNSLTFTITTGAGSPQAIAVDPAGNFAYVAGGGCSGGVGGYVSMYTINSTTGALASIGPPVSTYDEYTDSVTVDPSGKFAYVASGGDVWDIDFGSVSTYTINPTSGALTSTGVINGVYQGAAYFNSVAVDPSGKFAYAAEGGALPACTFGCSNSVSMYTINGTTGALTSIGTIAAGTGTVSVAVDPTGKFAYVANFGSNDVSMFTIDTTTGFLTSIGTAAAGLSTISTAIHPSGKFAYVANFGSNDVSMYTIDATTGVLTSMGPIVAGTGPVSVAVHPAGNFAYVANLDSNDVSMYAINATTGVLTTIGTIAAGSYPSSIAIHPSGKFAYVTNLGSNSVSMYSIDAATGALTLAGTIGT